MRRWFIMCKPPEQITVDAAMEDGVGFHGWVLFGWKNWRSFSDDEIGPEMDRITRSHLSSGFEYEAVSYEDEL